MFNFQERCSWKISLTNCARTTLMSTRKRLKSWQPLQTKMVKSQRTASKPTANTRSSFKAWTSESVIKVSWILFWIRNHERLALDLEMTDNLNQLWKWRGWYQQCGIICGTIMGSNRSLKAIDKRIFFCDKNAVFTNFHNKNAVLTSFCEKNYVFKIHEKHSQSVLLISNLFYR